MTISEKFMTLGTDYAGQDPLGWFVSEKLDGCRAFWDGRHLWTRHGKQIDAPAWFTAGLPATLRLDGEIYAGRGCFEQSRRAVQYGGHHFTRAIRFVVFDCPDATGDYLARMDVARNAVRQCCYAQAVAVDTITDRREVFARLQAIQARGGEGLMLRNPNVTHYERGRTANLLKVKQAHPAMMLLDFLKPQTRSRTGPNYQTPQIDPPLMV